ncbi:hypothetical protein M406DRAFT_27726, partial [Cryphonectria parasitica EP155]
HIICVDCGNSAGLNGPSPDHRNCPLCGTHLPRPDDVYVTMLNPTEEFKTRALTGLDPDSIMECAGRALKFWSLQMTHDLFVTLLAARLLPTLRDRYAFLQDSVDAEIKDANSKMTSLHSTIASEPWPTHGMSLDQESLQKKYNDLCRAYREKNHKLSQTQELYDKLKRKAMLGHIQDAASDAVDTSL